MNMTWIDFRKVYNMVPYSWMIKSLKLVGAGKNIINLLKENLKNGKTNVICSITDLGAVKQRKKPQESSKATRCYVYYL